MSETTHNRLKPLHSQTLVTPIQISIIRISSNIHYFHKMSISSGQVPLSTSKYPRNHALYDPQVRSNHTSAQLVRQRLLRPTQLLTSQTHNHDPSEDVSSVVTQPAAPANRPKDLRFDPITNHAFFNTTHGQHMISSQSRLLAA